MSPSASGTVSRMRPAAFGVVPWVLVSLPDTGAMTLEAATAFGERGGVFALLGIATVFILVTLLVAKVEGLAFLGPGASRAVGASARSFCTEKCRQGGRCPLTGTEARAENCPLWKYVAADVPLVRYGSPFEPVGTAPAEMR